MAELVGKREELELLAGRWRLAGDHQTANSDLGAVADALADRLGVDDPELVELRPVEVDQVIRRREREQPVVGGNPLAVGHRRKLHRLGRLRQHRRALPVVGVLVEAPDGFPAIRLEHIECAGQHQVLHLGFGQPIPRLSRQPDTAAELFE